MMQVELGCGKSKPKGAIGIDCDPKSDADIVIDFEKDPIPLEDNSVDRIASRQVFEHLDDPIAVLRRLYRILKPGGEIFIEVPHFSSYIAHGLGHKHYFSHKEVVQMFHEAFPCEIVRAEITFFKFFRWIGVHYLANRFPVTYERFWCYRFPAENLKITVRAIKESPREALHGR